MSIRKEVLSHFEIIEGTDSYSSVAAGKTSETYLVDMGLKPIVLQGRSSVIDGYNATARAVAAILHVRKFDEGLTPDLYLPIHDRGKALPGIGFTDKDGKTWMATQFWEDAGMQHPVQPEVVNKAAVLLADVTNYLNLDEVFIEGVIPTNREPIDYRIDRLHAVLDMMPIQYRQQADELLAQFHNVQTEGLPHAAEQRVIHGDAKSTNFLYKNDGSPYAMIDFEIIDLSSPSRDVGDMVRSFVKHYLIDCESKGVEPDVSKVKDIVDAAAEGYSRRSTGDRFSYEDALLAGIFMSLELAARYFIDAEKQETFQLEADAVCLRGLNYERADLQMRAVNLLNLVH